MKKKVTTIVVTSFSSSLPGLVEMKKNMMGAIIAFFFFCAESYKADEKGDIAITLFFSTESYMDEEEGNNIVAFFSTKSCFCQALFLPGLVEMRKKATVVVVTFFFAFLCGGVTIAKVVLPSLCLRKIRW